MDFITTARQCCGWLVVRCGQNAGRRIGRLHHPVDEIQELCLAALARSIWLRRSHFVLTAVPFATSFQLCRYAQEWADTLAKRDAFSHRPNNKYGENIYMAWSSDPTKEVTGREAVDSWYSEIKQHQFGGEPRSLGSGHFTQVIWKGSTELGTARARTATGKLLVVANYNPAGNMIGSFAQNVPPPKK
ncbi:hypothetical protein HPB48_006870 [Haemaphysalis longicornis]|uniref:SCP domain-containing protein n=1 Tax=Haemaphysalis longicornis TaxID=44386 RepID=A0A9J6FHD4_HAELO|nr:hypothetical protein HPB48_006870 [Haemaphysalis longicornis]